MAIKKTFSFRDEYANVLAHIENQGNASNYIIRLVQKDMQSKSIEETIEQIVDRKLAARNNDGAISNGLIKFLGK
jgi:hypothetical protein